MYLNEEFEVTLEVIKLVLLVEGEFGLIINPVPGNVDSEISNIAVPVDVLSAFHVIA
jgi:hypothetical protein